MSANAESRIDEPSCVFVYGTLKQGELRSSAWPRPPIEIRSATVSGALFDLGPFPGLVEGTDCVRGELWMFAPGDIAPTLAVLDRIEGYEKTEHDLYRRRVISCNLADGSSQSAWAYLYARPERLNAAYRIVANRAGECVWVGTSSRRTRGKHG